MSLALTVGLLALMSHTAHQTATPGRALDELRQLRFEGLQPRAAVMANEDSKTSIWAFYENSPDGGPALWIARRETSSAGELRTEIARSDICPQIYAQALALERLPIPGPEVRGPRSASPPEFVTQPPNLGPLHTSYTLWAKGWTSGLEPVELTVFHLGSGPIADWTAKAEADLDLCWSREDRPGPR